MPASDTSTPQPRHRRAAAALSDWSSLHRRSFGWRNHMGAYEIVVAEILLQKTKAEDAEPVWFSVISEFPTPASLADADERRLLDLVRLLGLGQQRAARLRGAAEDLRDGRATVRGLGPYGSAMVALALGKETKHAPVDSNIARVVCRWAGLSFERGEPRKKREVSNETLALMTAFAFDSVGAIYAVLDLAASTCRPKVPACSSCPLNFDCCWGRAAASSAPRNESAKARLRGGGTASDT